MSETEQKNRRISIAVFIGLFVAMLPIPGQMLVAGTLAAYAKAKVSASVALVWVSNPLTWAPLTWAAHKIGASSSPLVQTAEQQLAYDQNIVAVLLQGSANVLIGSLIMGLTFGVVGYLCTDVSLRFFSKGRAKNHSKS